MTTQIHPNTRLRILVFLVGLLSSSLSACLASVTTTPESIGETIETTSGTEGVVITGTLRIREGTELADSERVSISQYNGTVVSRRVGFDQAGYVPWMDYFVRQGNRVFQVRQDATGEAKALSGKEINTAIPDLIASSLGTTPQTGDRRLHELINLTEYPVADMSEVDQLVAESLITETTPTSHLGLAVRTFEANLADTAYYPTVLARIWLSAADGYKLKVERWLEEPGGDPDIVFTSQSINANINLGQGYFVSNYTDPDQYSDIKTDFVRIDAFDPISGTLPEVPEADALQYPVTLPVSDTFSLETSVFITGTMDSRLMEEYVRPWDGSLGDRKWWVAQEFSYTGNEVLIIQGPDSQLDPPVDLSEVWPPSWEGADPTVLLEHLFDFGTSGAFADSTPYSRYDLSDPATAPSRVWVPPYEYLVTWQEPGGIRVVALAKGLNADGAISFSESYRASTQE